MSKWILSLMGSVLLSGPVAAQIVDVCRQPPCVNYQVNFLQDSAFILEVDLAGLLDASGQGGGFNEFGTTPQQVAQNIMNLDAYLTLDGGVGPSPYFLAPSDATFIAMEAYLTTPLGGIYNHYEGIPIIGVKNPLTVSAPEIDPASVASGLTLLFGGLMVLRGRRQMKSS